MESKDDILTPQSEQGATMSIDWRHIRDELRERKDPKGLTDDEQSVLDEADAALARGERWMSHSGPEPDAANARESVREPSASE